MCNTKSDNIKNIEAYIRETSLIDGDIKLAILDLAQDQMDKNIELNNKCVIPPHIGGLHSMLNLEPYINKRKEESEELEKEDDK